MKKTVTYIICALMFALCLTGMIEKAKAASVLEKLSSADRNEIKNRIELLLNASTKRETRTTLQEVSVDVASDCERKRSAFLSFELGLGVSFDEVFHNTEIYELSISEEKVSLLVDDTTVVWYSYPNISVSTDYFAYKTPHEMVLEKRNGYWFIVRDSFDERSVTGVASHDIADETTDNESEVIGQGENKQQPTRTLTFSYSPSTLISALQYANQYCGLSSLQRLGIGYTEWRGETSNGTNNNSSNYNPNYADYYSSGGDCANFVSQILYEAGVRDIDGTWGYNHTTNTGTNAWISVTDFETFFGNSYSVQTISSGVYSNVFPGNPIFWTSSSGNHLMFCMGYNSAGVPVINCHTNDAFRVPITNPNYSGKTLKTILIATSNLHSHNSQQWFYNDSWHMRICTYCEYVHYRAAHTANLAGYCTVCGAQGPFVVPY